MLDVTIRGFKNVGRFSGRDTRGQFWPYCGAAFGLYLVGGWAVLAPVMAPVFMGSPPSVRAFQGMVGHFMLINMLLFVALVVLLAGAVARRLHDSGRSGFWGLLPLPFATYSVVMMFRLFSQFGTGTMFDPRLFMSVFVSNLIYMVGVVILIVLLVNRSTPTTNRYG